MHTNSRWRCTLLFALLCAASAATALLWLRLNHAPPTWDDAIYLSGSLRLYDALTEQGLPGFFRKFQSIFTIRAPLITALPTPFYLVFGRRWHAAFLVNIAAMFILFGAVFSLARRWWSQRAALVAVTIVGTMPLIYGLARWFMVEYTLTAAIAVVAWLLVESKYLERNRLAFLFGLACGFGLLLKISFVVFVGPMTLYAWIKSRNRTPALLLIAAPCAVISLPWYSVHLLTVAGNALAAGYGESATLQGTGPIFSVHSIGLYLWHVLREGVSVYYGALAILLGLWTVATTRGRSFLARFLREHIFTILWISPFLLFLFGGNKDIRYIAPVLPAFALILAAAIDELLPRNRTGGVLTLLLCAIPALYMCSVSFGFPVRAEELGYALHSDYAHWPLEQILADVSAHTIIKPGDRPIVVVGTDRVYFNADNIDLIATARHLPFQIEAIAHEKNVAVLDKRLALASFFVYKEGGEPESPVINPHFSDVVRRVRESAEFTEIGPGWPLPDGGLARIFQKIGGPSRLTGKSFFAANLDVSSEFAIDFGGMLELAGFSVTQIGDDLRIKYRWRSQSPADADYWCFTHVVDPQGKILDQFDHPLLDGDPSVRSWSQGMIALEQAQHRIAWTLAHGARLKVGVYDPVSGKRLRIAPLKSVAASRFSIDDDSTALVTHDTLR